MEKDIGKINKGEYQGTVTEIVVGVREYNGKVGVDIREFVTSEGYTGPRKKGLRIPTEKFKEFKEMINSITEEDLKEEPEEEKEEKEKLPKEQATLDEEMPDY
jgi:cell division protein FtsN